MLIIKVYVNEEQIDTVHIQNVGTDDGILTNYMIRKPKLMRPGLVHHRDKGWVPLAIKALQQIQAEKDKLRNMLTPNNLRR